MVNAGRDNKEVGAMTTCCCQTFMCSQHSQVSVLSKLCIMNTLLHFLFFLCQ